MPVKEHEGINNMLSLRGRVVVLSGGASGIGLATTLMLADQGASVWIADLAKEAPPQVKPFLEDGSVHYYGQIDISNRETCHNFITDVMQVESRLDGLVNCAGICPGEGTIASDEIFERVFAVNIRGTWDLATEALKIMEAAVPQVSTQARGVIVNCKWRCFSRHPGACRILRD